MLKYFKTIFMIKTQRHLSINFNKNFSSSNLIELKEDSQIDQQTNIQFSINILKNLFHSHFEIFQGN